MRRFALLCLGVLALPPPPAIAGIGCRIAPEAARLGVAMETLTERRRAGQPITIVLIGSALPETRNDTAESGGAAYLREALTKHWPEANITVLARSLPGYRAADLLDSTVAAIKPLDPALIVWQAGGAAAAHDTGIERLRDDLVTGLDRLREAGADIVLADLQFVRRWEQHPRYQAYLGVIRDVAEQEGVGLFRRYDLMKSLVKRNALTALQATGVEEVPLLDPTRCIAEALASAIASGNAVADTQ